MANTVGNAQRAYRRALKDASKMVNRFKRYYDGNDEVNRVLTIISCEIPNLLNNTPSEDELQKNEELTGENL